MNADKGLVDPGVTQVVKSRQVRRAEARRAGKVEKRVKREELEAYLQRETNWALLNDNFKYRINLDEFSRDEIAERDDWLKLNCPGEYMIRKEEGTEGNVLTIGFNVGPYMDMFADYFENQKAGDK